MLNINTSSVTGRRVWGSVRGGEEMQRFTGKLKKEMLLDPQKEGSSSTWTTSRIKTHGV